MSGLHRAGNSVGEAGAMGGVDATVTTGWIGSETAGRITGEDEDSRRGSAVSKL